MSCVPVGLQSVWVLAGQLSIRMQELEGAHESCRPLGEAWGRVTELDQNLEVALDWDQLGEDHNGKPGRDKE